MSQHDRALNEAEAAERLGIAAATLRNWRQQRVGPVFRRFGRTVRYMSGDLEAFIESSRPVPTPTDRAR